jgi:hypothetical protein
VRRSLRPLQLAVCAALLGLGPASGSREPAVEPGTAWPEVLIEGPSVASQGVRRLLERVLATATGARLRARIASGELREPIAIVLNTHRDNLTLYRVAGIELSQTILFDPAAYPLVETEAGMRAAPPETVLAHELGHAVLGLRSEQDVIRQVENPLRAELGLPLRVRF